MGCLVRDVGQVTNRGCGLAEAENIHELTREKLKACEVEGAQCGDSLQPWLSAATLREPDAQEHGGKLWLIVSVKVYAAGHLK